MEVEDKPEPYVPLELRNTGYYGWLVIYRNYLGHEHSAFTGTPSNKDELSAFKDALKVMRKYKRRADLRREKKEQVK